MNSQPVNDLSSYPLVCFDYVIVVDLDPQEWLPVDDGDKFMALLALTEGMSENITRELYDDETFPGLVAEYERTHPGITLAPKTDTEILWARMNNEVEVLFEDIQRYASVAFLSYWDDSLKSMMTFLRGALAEKGAPIQVAVVGATLENGVPDVVEVLNGLDGLNAVIVPRYCLSKAGFMNIDEMMADSGVFEIEC